MSAVIHQLALHRDMPSSWMVSRCGDTHVFAIPKAVATLTYVPGRFEPGPKGVKFAVVDIEMPDWIAHDRGLR